MVIWGSESSSKDTNCPMPHFPPSEGVCKLSAGALAGVSHRQEKKSSISSPRKMTRGKLCGNEVTQGSVCKWLNEMDVVFTRRQDGYRLPPPVKECHALIHPAQTVGLFHPLKNKNPLISWLILENKSFMKNPDLRCVYYETLPWGAGDKCSHPI